jgi:hypothetical protein
MLVFGPLEASFGLGCNGLVRFGLDCAVELVLTIGYSLQYEGLILMVAFVFCASFCLLHFCMPRSVASFARPSLVGRPSVARFLSPLAFSASVRVRTAMEPCSVSSYRLAYSTLAYSIRAYHHHHPKGNSD